jgi:uncharacterized protein YbjT (DUF2867 family)
MKVLVCGASGFIGGAVCEQLRAAGHEVLRGVRRAEQPGDVQVDYCRDTRAELWLARLRGVDAVVNAVGVIRERGAASFDALHARAPAALFKACALAKVRRVVQLSALGAASGGTPYFTSKRTADEALMALPLEWTVLRPSLVFGRDGASAAMFCRIASLPLLVTPALPAARYQPVHIDELVRAVVQALDPAAPVRCVINVAGRDTVSFDQMLAAYRHAMGLPPAPVVHISAALVSGAAWVGGKLPGAMLTPDNWRMLRAGSALAADGAASIVSDRRLSPAEGELLRLRSQASWRNALLRCALALVWLATALVSVFVYPRAGSLALLARAGIAGWPATLALYGAAGLDAAFGIASLAWPRRTLWLAQGALVLGYSLVIAACMPEYLWHPFGPLLKNVPILAILFILLAEEKSWTT